MTCKISLAILVVPYMKRVVKVYIGVSSTINPWKKKLLINKEEYT